jgi:hypothetical protein
MHVFSMVSLVTLIILTPFLAFPQLSSKMAKTAEKNGEGAVIKESENEEQLYSFWYT